MGKASASAAASTGIQSTGGNLNINQPNTLMWIVLAVVAVLAFAWWKGRK